MCDACAGTHTWVCEKCQGKTGHPVDPFHVHRYHNTDWKYSRPVPVKDGQMYEFDGAQHFHDVVAFAPDVAKHVVRYSFVLQREMSLADADEVGQRTIEAASFKWGDVSRDALLNTLRKLPYQTWLNESTEEDSVDYPSAWLNVMTGGKWDTLKCLTVEETTLLKQTMEQVKRKSHKTTLDDVKLVVNAMSTAWPFTMGGHSDDSVHDNAPAVLATTLVLVDDTGPIVTLAGLEAKVAHNAACTVRHYARLVRENDGGGPGDDPTTTRVAVLAAGEYEGKCFGLVKAGTALPRTGVALGHDQWEALDELVKSGATVPVIVRLFLEETVASASISFFTTTFRAHPWYRPCPLPNEPLCDRRASPRNAYLQILTNEAGLWEYEAGTVPAKLRPYVRELTRYQTNPLEVPIVSLRNLDGGDATSFAAFVRAVWDGPGCPFRPPPPEPQSGAVSRAEGLEAQRRALILGEGVPPLTERNCRGGQAASALAAWFRLASEKASSHGAVDPVSVYIPVEKNCSKCLKACMPVSFETAAGTKYELTGVVSQTKERTGCRVRRRILRTEPAEEETAEGGAGSDETEKRKPRAVQWYRCNDRVVAAEDATDDGCVFSFGSSERITAIVYRRN